MAHSLPHSGSHAWQLKSEIRRPGSEPNPKPEEHRRDWTPFGFRISDFFLASDFGCRIWDLGFGTHGNKTRYLSSPTEPLPRIELHPVQIHQATLTRIDEEDINVAAAQTVGQWCRHLD